MPKGSIRLKQTDGPTEVDLNVWHDAPGIPGGFTQDEVSPLPVPQPTDETNYQTHNPEFGRAFDQSNWAGGYGEGRVHRLDREDHYGYTDGVLAMFEHQLMPSYQEDLVGVMVKNPSFQDTSIGDYYSTSNATLAASTDADDGDSAAMQITADANSGSASQTYAGPLTPLEGRTFVFTARIKRLSGSGSITLRMNDNVNGFSDSSASSATSYTTVTVSHTVGSSITAVGFHFQLSTSGDVFVVDNVCVIPDGGLAWNSRPIAFKGSHPSKREGMYIAAGRCILKWEEGGDVFYPVYVDSTYSITDLEVFGTSTARLYAARGDDTNYLMSADGLTWGNPTLNGDEKDYATKFVRAQNANSDQVLMKSRASSISVNESPEDATAWGAEIPVGTVDRPITSLLATNGIAYVGKTDGLYVFDRGNSKMRDIEPDANFFVDPDNFKTSIGRGGVVYTTGGQASFWRVWPAEEGAVIHRWLDLTELLIAPSFKNWGGRVEALAQDRQNIWVLMADDANAQVTEFPYTFEFSFSRPRDSAKMRLLALRPPARDQQDFVSDSLLVPHSVTAISNMSEATQMGRFVEDAASSLFVFGRQYDSAITGSIGNVARARVVRLRLPTSADNPALASSIEVRKSGDFFTPWIDWQYPDIEKALNKITVNTKNCDLNRTVTVYYKTDDDTDDDSTGWTQFPDSDTKVTTSPTKVLSIGTDDSVSQITFRRIRLKFSFSSTSNTADPPIVTGYVLHVSANANAFRRFRAVVKIGDRRFTTGRRRSELLPAETIASRLRDLEAEPYVTVTTPLGDEYQANITVQTAIAGKRVSGNGRRVDYTRVLTIDGIETRTT